jgi:ferredoxin
VTPPPLLWGEWRCTDDPRTFIAPCLVCGALVIINRRGLDDWRAACENGCPRAAMDAAAGLLLAEQRAEQRYEDDREKTMDTDDPLSRFEADYYIEALTGREVKRGFVQCPFHGDGDERTASLHTTGNLWYCHGCGAGGSIYDFGALLYGIEPRKSGFDEIRVLLGRDLLKGAAR